MKFSGNSEVPSDTFLSGFPLQAGGIFEPARLERATAAVRTVYGKLGYRDAEVDYDVVRDDALAQVNVSIAITEKKQTFIGSIAVEGNNHTSEEYALRQLLVTEGSPANDLLVRDSVTNLSRTGAYAAADLQLRPPAEPSSGPKQVADVVVAIAEPKPFRLQYGGFYHSDNGPGVITDFENRSWVGDGRVLGLRVRYDSRTQDVRLYLSQPVWRRHQLSTTLSTYFTREAIKEQVVPTDKVGIAIQQDWPFAPKWLLSYGYRYEVQKNWIPEEGETVVPTKRVTVTPLTLTMSRDSRDSFLDATKGWFASHSLEYAPGALGSDYPYIRSYLQLFKYFPLRHPQPAPYGQAAPRSRLVFATGSRVGMLHGFNPQGTVLTDRFFAGGEPRFVDLNRTAWGRRRRTARRWVGMLF